VHLLHCLEIKPIITESFVSARGGHGRAGAVPIGPGAVWVGRGAEGPEVGTVRRGAAANADHRPTAAQRAMTAAAAAQRPGAAAGRRGEEARPGTAVGAGRVYPEVGRLFRLG